MSTQQPIRQIHDKRLSYLVALDSSFKEMGYTTKLNGRDNILEVYSQGYILPVEAVQPLEIEK